MSKELTFCCPKCQGSVIEEVQAEVIVSTEINVLYEDGLIMYGEATNEGGYVVRYNCRNCGYTIVDNMPDEQELIEALMG